MPTHAMPAASAARMPGKLSSTTMQACGGMPSAAAAARNTSGAGLPAATSRALCTRSATSGAKPVRANFTAIS